MALTRHEAVRIARDRYRSEAGAAEASAVVELVLLAHNSEDQLLSYAAENALTWFDPEIDLPEERLPEPPAVRAFRWAVYAHDLEARKAALNALLVHLERWK